MYSVANLPVSLCNLDGVKVHPSIGNITIVSIIQVRLGRSWTIICLAIGRKLYFTASVQMRATMPSATPLNRWEGTQLCQVR